MPFPERKRQQREWRNGNEAGNGCLWKLWQKSNPCGFLVATSSPPNLPESMSRESSRTQTRHVVVHRSTQKSAEATCLSLVRKRPCEAVAYGLWYTLLHPFTVTSQYTLMATPPAPPLNPSKPHAFKRLPSFTLPIQSVRTHPTPPKENQYLVNRSEQPAFSRVDVEKRLQV